jgi:hypothetical protein
MAPGSMAGEDDAVGETLSVLHGVADSPEALEALADGLRPLAVRLPAEVREGPDGIDPTDSQTLTRLLGEVERTLPGLIAGERTP